MLNGDSELPPEGGSHGMSIELRLKITVASAFRRKPEG
jgi:hypothetical protein